MNGDLLEILPSVCSLVPMSNNLAFIKMNRSVAHASVDSNDIGAKFASAVELEAQDSFERNVFKVALEIRGGKSLLCKWWRNQM